VNFFFILFRLRKHSTLIFAFWLYWVLQMLIEAGYS